MVCVNVLGAAGKIESDEEDEWEEYEEWEYVDEEEDKEASAKESTVRRRYDRVQNSILGTTRYSERAQYHSV